jgi:hypothetical protein
MKSSFLAMAMMASMMEDISYPKQNKGREYVPIEPPKKVIPKGCCEYYFTKSGTQVSGTCTYIYFSCIASSRKVALKKFNSFIDSNQAER